MSPTAVLALGSNLGDSRQILDDARRRVWDHPRITLHRSSPVAVTAPVGGPEGQPDYLNQVLHIQTDLGPFRLLEFAQRLEQDFHRVREVRWGPRTLDVDIIVYGSLHMDEPALTLPHPRAAQRAFVLLPWERMDPEARLDGVPVGVLARQAPDAGGILRWLPENPESPRREPWA